MCFIDLESFPNLISTPGVLKNQTLLIRTVYMIGRKEINAKIWVDYFI